MEAFPLSWPAGWKRTRSPQQSRFGQKSWANGNSKPSIAKGTNKVLDEIRRMGGSSVIISTNLKLKNDGLPYSAQREPDDKGVAVYFTKMVNGNRESLCIACDSYDKIGCNLWAIGSSIEAMRSMERWGCSEMLNRAFTGFKALPDTATATAPVTWRSILRLNGHPTKEEVKEQYRLLAMHYHPDKPGGSAEKFHVVNKAYEEAKKELNFN